MAIPKRHEAHYIGCALCGEMKKLGSHAEIQGWLFRHARDVHHKTGPYFKDAVRSVTILYETSVEGQDQPADHTDPTIMFLNMITRMLKAKEI